MAIIFQCDRCKQTEEYSTSDEIPEMWERVDIYLLCESCFVAFEHFVSDFTKPLNV
jgi:hypothetical protein